MRITAIIPARMDSTRLPGKPLADIGGTPMVVHAWRAAQAHPDIDDVLVATDHPDIAEAVRHAGGNAVMTGEHPSGTDRCHAAWLSLGPDAADHAVINLQGDEPFPDGQHIAALCRSLRSGDAVATVRRPAAAGEADLPERVKVECDAGGRALRFSRRPVPPAGPHHIHIGLYGFGPGSLDRCARLPLGRLEQEERLEQLRWLEAGIPIQVVDVEEAEGPGSVDTAEDLERVRAWYGKRTSAGPTG